MRELIAAWNRRDIVKYFRPEDFSSSRTADLLTTEVPRSAEVRILALDRITVVSQEAPKLEKDGSTMQASVVSVLVRTQLEFNHPERGFQRYEGINEYVVQVRETFIPAAKKKS